MIIPTRSIIDSKNNIDEEKKDDENIREEEFAKELVCPDGLHLLTLESVSCNQLPIQQPELTESPFLLLLCAFGITSCYLWYGTVQEQFFQTNSNNKDESITLFLLSTGTFSSFFIAWFWTSIGSKLTIRSTVVIAKGIDATIEGSLNHSLLLLTSITYLSAMASSNESLHYVSYPTCVLAKSSKLIPTMVVGWIVDEFRGQNRITVKTSHSSVEWLSASLITMGILSFQYKQLHNHRNLHGTTDVRADSPFGLLLLGLSLFMDGLLGACQDALKRQSPPTVGNTRNIRPPTAMETMLYINLYATLVLLPASYYFGQFQSAMRMLVPNGISSPNNDIGKLLLQLNLSASLGQVFIFLTIYHFSPLICTTITTTRKFFTILLSVYKFGHVLDIWQWASVGLVFFGLYIEIASKIIGKQHAIPMNKKRKVE